MSVADSSEADLVSRIAKGDSDAFATLFDRHSSTILGMLIQLLRRRDLAEEILQDVFMQAWSQAGRYRADRATPCGWLLMLARSRAIDHLRSSQARSQREEAFETDPSAARSEAPVGTADLEARERQGQVLHALASLSEEQRRCVELSFFEGLSHSQIAAHLEEPLGTVKSRILLGMRKPVNVLQRGCDVETIVNMAAMTVLRAAGDLDISG